MFRTSYTLGNSEVGGAARWVNLGGGADNGMEDDGAMLKNQPESSVPPMGVAAFLLRESEVDGQPFLQVVTDNIDNRHEVLLLPREKHTIGSLIHFLNILGFHGDIVPCTIMGTQMDTSAWRVDYDPDGEDINAYRLTVT